MNFKEENKYKKGRLITVTYSNGNQKSGIITKTDDTQIQFSYFDKSIEAMETSIISQNDFASGRVVDVKTVKHLKFAGEGTEKVNTSKTSELVTIDSVKAKIDKKQVDELVSLFLSKNEAQQATVAALLTGEKKYEFMYKVSQKLDDNGKSLLAVIQEFDNSKEKVESALRAVNETLESQYSTETNREEKDFSKEFNEQLKDILGDGVFGGLIGGNSPFGGFIGGDLPKGLEDMFKNLNPNKMNDFGKGNKPPEIPKEMKDQIEKIFKDIFGNGDK